MIILKNKIKLLSLIVLIININKTFAEDYVDEFCSLEPKKITPDEKNTINKLSTGQINFAINSLDKTASIMTKENVVFSPHSIYEALLIIYIGSDGSTMKNVKKILGIPDDLTQDDIEKFYISDYWKKTCPKYMNNTLIRSKFLIANRVYMSTELKIHNKILKRISEKFNNTICSMSKLNKIRKNINNWVEDNTEKNIPDIISPGGISCGTDIIFVNGVYMKTFWKNSFDPASLKIDLFYGHQNTNATYMIQKKNYLYKYSTYLEAEVIELPYDDDDINMYIFLPTIKTTKTVDDSNGQFINDVDGIKKLIYQMKTTQGIAELVDIFVNYKMDKKIIKVLFPQFIIEKELPIDNILDSIKAGDLIGRKINPNLSKFTDNNIYLADVVHKTKIIVNEDGIEPVHYSETDSQLEADEETVTFIANRPFVYLIFNKFTKTILIAGIHKSN